jgi:hypothetical protein
MIQSKTSFLAVLLSCGIIFCGCHSKEPVGKVTGKVTFQSQPVSEGIVLFRNITKGISMTCVLRPDGSYTVATAKGAGLPLGVYEVSVCPPPRKILTGAPAEPVKSYPNIPQEYRDFGTSGLAVTLQDGDNTFHIAM